MIGSMANRKTLLKIFLFLGIYGCMMMWRRLQLAACQEKRLIQHVAHGSASNATRHLPRTDDILTLFDYEINTDSLSTTKNKKNRNKIKDGNFKSDDHIWNTDKVLFELSPNILSELKTILSVKADQNRTILISIVDSTLKELALNFYILSLQEHGISNFILICLDLLSQSYLQKHGISCLLFHLGNASTLADNNDLISESKENADFGSDQYYTKTNVKSLFMLETLKLQYNVLMCDIDIIFFKYPFKYLTCSDCDILVSMDRDYWNSGFVYAKPTENSIILYTRTWKLYNHYHLSHDQAYLNMARKLMMQDRLPLKAIELSSKQFPCGYYYFEQEFREFNNQPPCTECIMAHNNYIGSTAAKTYRFRENLLWFVDNGYYSDLSTKFLNYSNSLDLDEDTYDVELDALKTALILGFVSDRVVILPTFHCCNCKTKKCHMGKHRCSLLHTLKLKTFDAVFGGKYRESSFLTHSLVPPAIKSADIAHLNISPSKQSVCLNATSSTNMDQKHTFTINSVAQHEEFKTWMRTFDSVPVVSFESLNINVTGLVTVETRAQLDLMVNEAFQCSGYEQWEVKPFV